MERHPSHALRESKEKKRCFLHAEVRVHCTQSLRRMQPPNDGCFLPRSMHDLHVLTYSASKSEPFARKEKRDNAPHHDGETLEIRCGLAVFGIGLAC